MASSPRRAVRGVSWLMAGLVVVLLLAPACSGGQKSAKKQDSTPAVDTTRKSLASTPIESFSEPLSKYQPLVLYEACTSSKYRTYPNGESLDIQDDPTTPTYILRLVPFDSTQVLRDQDGSWQANGKFVGVVENRGPDRVEMWNVDGMKSGKPGLTCVWFGIDKETNKLMMRFVGPRGFTSVDAVRLNHAAGHRLPLAAWNPKSDSLVQRLEKEASDSSAKPQTVRAFTLVPLERLAVFTDIAWYTCDQTGCCRKQ